MKWEDILYACRQYDCYSVIEKLFSSCPPLIRNYLTLQTYPAGQLLIEAGASCNTVYILIFGRLHAIEERAGDTPYSFFDLVPFDIVGDYELFSDDTENYVTVRARQLSVCLTLPARFYLQWISSDSGALFFRTKLLMKILTRQLSANRRFLMMSYEQRCIYVICQEARNVPMSQGSCLMKLNRELLAARAGCSLRTAHRVLKELEQRGHLQLTGGKIRLTREQLEAMWSSLDELETLGGMG